MIARTRRPDADDSTEHAVADVVSRLCRQIDLPVPEVRLRETHRPLCYTVRYPVETSPKDLLAGADEVYQTWAEETHEDGGTIADEPISADHVLVVSTGLVETLPEDELAAVLAHEVAHLRNGDLALLNALMLPIFWAESVAQEFDSSHPREVIGHVFLRLPITIVTAAVTSLGVVVFSRGREFAADRGGAELAGDPAALATALERLEGVSGDRPDRDLRSVAVANVLPLAAENQPWRLTASHPSTERRIERLRAMVAASES